jgi:DNA polymerase-4
MQRLGIHTGADLRAQTLSVLQQHFGKSAAWYLGVANGEDDRPVVPDRQRKSSGSETTFERDLTASADIEAGVAAMVDDVWGWCEKAGAFGRTVTVKVKFADFRQVTRSRSFATAIARHDALRQASLDLVRTLLPTAMGVRLLGVTVSNFDQASVDASEELVRRSCHRLMLAQVPSCPARARAVAPLNGQVSRRRLFFRHGPA